MHEGWHNHHHSRCRLPQGKWASQYLLRVTPKKDSKTTLGRGRCSDGSSQAILPKPAVPFWELIFLEKTTVPLLHLIFARLVAADYSFRRMVWPEKFVWKTLLSMVSIENTMRTNDSKTSTFQIGSSNIMPKTPPDHHIRSSLVPFLTAKQYHSILML